MSSSTVTTQRAALLAIGDEVLRGKISNTNAAFIAERLFELGYELTEQLVVSDDRRPFGRRWCACGPRPTSSS